MFSCPASAEKCPQGSDAELRTIQVGATVTRSKSWPRLDIRQTTYCKYRVKHDGPMIQDTKRFEFNNMNIRLVEAD